MDELHLTSCLSALGHTTRLRAVKLLLATPDGLPAGKLAKQLGNRQNSLSPHLGILARNHLVFGKRQGREIIYFIDNENLARLLRHLERSLMMFAERPSAGGR
jgi:ArsR family transcriptional regulator, arsenate/arsenite/antimonite-responsive transcriptional repressor